jgi:hypothetical protein
MAAAEFIRPKCHRATQHQRVGMAVRYALADIVPEFGLVRWNVVPGDTRGQIEVPCIGLHSAVTGLDDLCRRVLRPRCNNCRLVCGLCTLCGEPVDIGVRVSSQSKKKWQQVGQDGGRNQVRWLNMRTAERTESPPSPLEFCLSRPDGAPALPPSVALTPSYTHACNTV